MKKLLSFLVAGIVALGLASCSGDLHNEFDPSSALGKYLFGDGTVLDKADLCGSIDGWTGSALTKEEDGTYTFEFTASAEEEQFSIREVAGSWTAGNRWCGALKKDEENALKVKDGGSATLIYSDDPDPSHCKLVGLKIGTTYTLTFTIEDENVSVALSSGGVTPYYLAGYFLRTSQNNDVIDGTTVLLDPSVDKKTGVVTYIYNFTFDSSLSAAELPVTDPATEVAFRITKGSSDEGYYGGSFAYGTSKDFVPTSLGGNSLTPNIISGLENGKDYRLIIQTTPDKVVSYKVLGKQTVVLSGAKFVATGLPSELEGLTLYLTGGFTGWATPGTSGSVAAVVTNGTIEATVPDLTGEFIGDDPQEFPVAGKFASSGWTTPEIVQVSNYDNIEVTFTTTKKTAKGTFQSKKSDEDKYGCSWTVE